MQGYTTYVTILLIIRCIYFCSLADSVSSEPAPGVTLWVKGAGIGGVEGGGRRQPNIFAYLIGRRNNIGSQLLVTYMWQDKVHPIRFQIVFDHGSVQTYNTRENGCQRWNSLSLARRIFLSRIASLIFCLYPSMSRDF